MYKEEKKSYFIYPLGEILFFHSIVMFNLHTHIGPK